MEINEELKNVQKEESCIGISIRISDSQQAHHQCNEHILCEIHGGRGRRINKFHLITMVGMGFQYNQYEGIPMSFDPTCVMPFGRKRRMSSEIACVMPFKTKRRMTFGTT